MPFVDSPAMPATTEASDAKTWNPVKLLRIRREGSQPAPAPPSPSDLTQQWLQQHHPVASTSQPRHVQSSELLVPLPGEIFAAPNRPTLLHSLVLSHLSSLRHSNAVNKNRGQVKGSGAKMYQQKGTGRARMRDRQNPIRRGGGRIHAKTSARNWLVRVNRTAWVQGMKVALSLRWRDGTLGVIDGVPHIRHHGRLGVHNGVPGIRGTGSTREVERLLTSTGLLDNAKSGTLFLLGDETVGKDAARDVSHFVGAARKLQGVEIKRALDVNVVELLRSKRIMFDLAGLSELVAKLQSYRGLLGHPTRPVMADKLALPPSFDHLYASNDADVHEYMASEEEWVDEDGADVPDEQVADLLLEDAQGRPVVRSA